MPTTSPRARPMPGFRPGWSRPELDRNGSADRRARIRGHELVALDGDAAVGGQIDPQVLERARRRPGDHRAVGGELRSVAVAVQHRGRADASGSTPAGLDGCRPASSRTGPFGVAGEEARSRRSRPAARPTCTSATFPAGIGPGAWLDAVQPSGNASITAPAAPPRSIARRVMQAEQRSASGWSIRWCSSEHLSVGRCVFHQCGPSREPGPAKTNLDARWRLNSLADAWKMRAMSAVRLCIARLAPLVAFAALSLIAACTKPTPRYCSNDGATIKYGCGPDALLQHEVFTPARP